MGVLAYFEGLYRGSLFIETGTGRGATLSFAASYFHRCVSAERDPRLYREAVATFSNRPHVSIFHGNSAEILRRVIEPATPTVFWLDAHYTGNGEVRGPNGECPLLDELRVIGETPWSVSPVILIDDAFMFDLSLPSPCDRGRFNLEQWPDIEECDALLPGYTRSLRGEDVFEYRKVTAR